MSQLALAWVLHQRNVAAVIIGATRPEQVHENADAADVELHAPTRSTRDRRRAQNSGGVVSSGSIRQPPSGAAVACQSSSKPSSGVGR